MRYLLITISFIQLSAIASTNDSAVQACDNMSSTNEKIKCLTEICSNSEITASTNLDTCDNNRDKIKGIFIEFCRNTITPSYKHACLLIVAPSKFIDARAFYLCTLKRDGQVFIDCLSNIVNNTYHPAVIEECAEKNSFIQIRCLSKYGSPIDEQDFSLF